MFTIYISIDCGLECVRNMDAARSWLWILAIITLNLLSQTSSEAVKRQAANETKSPETNNDLQDATSPSDEVIPITEVPLNPDLTVKPLTIESKDNNTENANGISKSDAIPLSKTSPQIADRINKNKELDKNKESKKTGREEKSELSEWDIELDTIVPENNVTAAVVHEMLQSVELKNSTDNFVTQFNRRYALLPQIEADNLKWTKFSRAVAENFILDFSKMYEVENNSSMNSTTESDDDYWDEDEPLDYEEIYSLALSHLREKKGQTALQLAVPVRQTLDLYRAVLVVPIGIVQSKCKPYMSNWQCHAEYLAQLTDESEYCDHIWHHAEIHLKIAKALEEEKKAEDPIDIIIEELQSGIRSAKKHNSNSLLRYIIKTLRKLKERLREPLISNAQLFDNVKDSQRKGLLQCMNVDQL